jgi:hypothetical protein
VNLVDHGLKKGRADEVLIAHLTGVKLHRHLAGQLHSKGLIEPDHTLGRDVLQKINSGFFHKSCAPFSFRFDGSILAREKVRNKRREEKITRKDCFESEIKNIDTKQN